MKDQKKLVIKCLMNDIPVMALAGRDMLALPTAKFYLLLAQENGCSKEFIDDLQELVKWYEEYSTENPDKMKLPD